MKHILNILSRVNPVGATGKNGRLCRMQQIAGRISFGIVIGCLYLTQTHNITAQDIEAVMKAPMMAANGGVSLSQIYTHRPDNNFAADPYALYLSGNLNFNFFGAVNVPLSFAYTNQQLSGQTSLPFNRFSLAPSYKWIKAYAGYSSLFFSPYTLSGHEIFGGGAEVTLENGFRVSAIYGRLKKSVDESEDIPPSYRRTGGGFKVEYSGKDFDAGFNLFKATDDPTSVRFLNPDSISVTPQDNLSGSVTLGIKFVENMTLAMEYAVSALNNDIGVPENGDDKKGVRILDTEGDLAVRQAVKANLSYQLPFGTAGTTYERVSPNYNTLGSYYMINDYENITAGFSTSIKNINIAVDGGYQHDNLKTQKTNTSSRIIYSGNISAPIGKRLSLGADFSNIQSYVHIRDVYDQVTQTNEFQNLDTLNFTQLNYTTSLNASYMLQSTQQQRQSINAGLMYQKASERQENSSYAGNNIYNSALSYQYSLLPQKFNASASINYNHNQMPDMYTGTLSGNLSLQKAFGKGVKTAFTCTYGNVFNKNDRLADIVNIRISGGYTLLKRHNFNLSLAGVYNKGTQKTTRQYSANLAYSYVFGFTLARKNGKLTTETNF